MRELMNVKEVKDGYVYMLTQRKVTCESCAMSGACSIMGSPDTKVKAKNIDKLDLKEGDYVVVELPNVSVTKLSFLVYGIPLIVFIVFTVLFYYLNFGDYVSFLLGLAATALSFVFMGYLDRHKFQDKYLPVILEKYELPVAVPANKSIDDGLKQQ